jgi:hypothetical protein
MRRFALLHSQGRRAFLALLASYARCKYCMIFNDAKHLLRCVSSLAATRLF